MSKDAPGTSPVGALLFDRRTVAGGADVVFEVGVENNTQQFLAHSSVMTAVSPVMESMLTGQFKEACERHVRLRDVSASQFSAFLELLYTGSMTCLVPPCFVLDRPQGSSIPALNYFVHVTGTNAKCSAWKKAIKAAKIYEHVARGSGVYTKCKKSSDVVEEAWFGCASIDDASLVAAKLLSDASTVKESQVQVTSVAERVLDIAALLDRFSVSHFDELILNQLHRYAGWDQECMFPMLCQAWSMNPTYKRAVVKMCERACCSEKVGIRLPRPADTVPEPEETGFLDLLRERLDECQAFNQWRGKVGTAVRLQLLTWALCVSRDMRRDFFESLDIIHNPKHSEKKKGQLLTAMEDNYDSMALYLDEVERLVREALQQLVELSDEACPEQPNPAKRPRV
eukprot:TRINITY_DN30629_c0_g1_i1.p1 TRINITY_DN30629_c0_g1~~TRINITY_DN30629_c0_g1_i1.p1  ORF type:complete len:451 (-),score=54.33 TRINITY_DN30629_c0_g1_i1:11-1204(-)